MQVLIETLNNQNLTLGSVESLTGGLFASEIVGCSNASKVFLGSIVAYANDVKEHLLKVDANIIKQNGVVSSSVVKAMCDGAERLLNVDITIAFSGNAGPDALENKPVGAVYTCIKINNEYFVYYDELNGDRNMIRNEVVRLGKDRIIQLLV